MTMQINNRSQSEEFEGEVVETTALATLTKSEIDMQISTAHRYPRSVQKAVNEARTMAMLNPQTAESMFYSLPRKQAGGGTKNITGPSVRLAEIFYACWGNMRVAARIIDETDKYIVAQGIAHDLERNVAVSTEVRRRITTKTGAKFSDDMVIVTTNAALAIARRNAIYQVCPRVYIEQVLKDAMAVVRGDLKTLEQRRIDTVAGLTKKYGITEARVLGAVERASIGDVDLDDLLALKGLVTSITEGSTTIDKAFPEVDQDKIPVDGKPMTTGAQPGKNSAADIVDKLNAKSSSVAKITEQSVRSEGDPAADAATTAGSDTPAPTSTTSTDYGKNDSALAGSDAATETQGGQDNAASNESATTPNVSTWPLFKAAAQAIAADHGVAATVVEKTLNALKLGDAGSSRASVGPSTRTRYYDAIVHGAFDWATGKVAD